MTFYNIFSAFAQDTEVPASCNNRLFDWMVNRSLSYTVPVMDVDQLHAAKSKYTILDARELKEFQVSSIPGAIHIGFDNFDPNKLKNLDKKQPIVIYCSIGYRSEKIGEKLIDLGFTEVYNLYGSIFEWVNRGYPLVNPLEEQALSVHGYSKLWGMWINNKKVRVVY